MISDKLGRVFHDRYTRGKQLTDEEQAQLESWYEYHDNLESEMLGISTVMNRELIQSELPVVPSKQEAMLAAEIGRGLMDTLSDNKEYRLQLLQKSLPSQEFVIPPSAMLLLVQILTEMGQGHAVLVTPVEQEKNTSLSDVRNHGADNIGLGTRIAQRFAAIGGIDLDIPARSMARPAPIFTDEAS